MIEQDIYIGQDFYVPAFRVRVRGREMLQAEYDVLSVTYTDSDEDMDSFDLTVNNWDPDGDGPGHGWFKYSDTDVFDPWQDVELSMGYYRNGNDELESMLVGEIVRMTPNFPESGVSTLTVHCVSLLQRFRISQLTRDYFQKQDSWIARDLVESIAKDIRQKIPALDLKVDDDEINRNLGNEKPIEHLNLHQQYAVNFLFARSREIGYDIWLDEETDGSRRTVTFHYAPSKYILKPTYILEWGKSLMSFQPSFSTANQPDEVIVRYWNPKTKQKFEGTATRADLALDGIIDPTADFGVKQGPLSKKTELVTDLVVQSDDEAKTAAKSRLKILAQGLIEGKGKAVGLPDLRSGNKIRIVGLGRYDGLYHVTSTTHTIGDGGYVTDFSARKEKVPNS
jgi:Bacteriophage probable baseplate hub protein